MKVFDNPVITEMEDLNIEPVYAASGWSGTRPDPQTTPSSFGGITVNTEWCNHNSGSHSEIKLIINNNSGTSGDNIVMNFMISDFDLVSITPGDSCLTVSNMSERSFTLGRYNRKFNPGENIAFVMQLKCKKPGGGVGAVGETGRAMACNVYCTGVYTS